ncbi:hypothetical protein ACJX0J_039536, partial [Zea mays]
EVCPKSKLPFHRNFCAIDSSCVPSSSFPHLPQPVESTFFFISANNTPFQQCCKDSETFWCALFDLFKNLHIKEQRESFAWDFVPIRFACVLGR